MFEKVTEYGPRRHRLLLELAAGKPVTEAAKASGYHEGSVYRMLRRDPQMRAELLRLRTESEERLLEFLPALIEKAVDVVGHAMNHRDVNIRLKAAAIALRLGSELTRAQQAAREAGGEEAEAVILNDNAQDSGNPNGQGGPTPCEIFEPKR